MLEERRKAELLSQGLLRYFFLHQINKVQLNVDFEAAAFSVTVCGTIAEPPNDLAAFTSVLNQARDVDLEDYLQGLVGTHHETEDFSLLGIMTDDVAVDYDDQVLKITLYREKK